jgi:catechol 2,3-dioxygenase-like lactoylglutathione lyase family enzyme
MSLRARGIDHIVLRVRDVERSLAWYQERLGLQGVRVEEWRAGKVLFPSLRLDSSTIIDLLEAERTGENVDHLCVEIDPVDLEAVRDGGEFDVVSGPSELFGARGQGIGLYVRDPDGNVVELRHYGT